MQVDSFKLSQILIVAKVWSLHCIKCQILLVLIIWSIERTKEMVEKNVQIVVWKDKVKVYRVRNLVICLFVFDVFIEAK